MDRSEGTRVQDKHGGKELQERKGKEGKKMDRVFGTSVTSLKHLSSH